MTAIIRYRDTSDSWKAYDSAEPDYCSPVAGHREPTLRAQISPPAISPSVPRFWVQIERRALAATDRRPPCRFDGRSRPIELRVRRGPPVGDAPLLRGRPDASVLAAHPVDYRPVRPFPSTPGMFKSSNNRADIAATVAYALVPSCSRWSNAPRSVLCQRIRCRVAPL
jgi:hypothetical protein